MDVMVCANCVMDTADTKITFITYFKQNQIPFTLVSGDSTSFFHL